MLNIFGYFDRKMRYKNSKGRRIMSNKETVTGFFTRDPITYTNKGRQRKVRRLAGIKIVKDGRKGNRIKLSR